MLVIVSRKILRYYYNISAWAEFKIIPYWADLRQLDSISVQLFDLDDSAIVFDLSWFYYQVSLHTSYVDPFFCISSPLISIVTSKFWTNLRPRMNWLDSSRFSTTTKLIHKCLHPSSSEMMGGLSATRITAWLAAASRILVVSGPIYRSPCTSKCVWAWHWTPRRCQAVLLEKLRKLACPVRPARVLPDQLRSRCGLHPVQAWHCIQFVVLWAPHILCRSGLLDHLPSPNDSSCRCLCHPHSSKLSMDHRPPYNIRLTSSAAAHLLWVKLSQLWNPT